MHQKKHRISNQIEMRCFYMNLLPKISKCIAIVWLNTHGNVYLQVIQKIIRHFVKKMSSVFT